MSFSKALSFLKLLIIKLLYKNICVTFKNSLTSCLKNICFRFVLGPRGTWVHLKSLETLATHSLRGFKRKLHSSAGVN